MSRAPHPHHPQPTVVKQQYDVRNVWEFENHWHTELCSCKPFGRCCFACVCSCCMGCKLASHLGESAIFGCCVPCSLCHFRTKLRTARRIDGSCCTDFCFGFPCCCACNATQLAAELESQGMWDAPKARKQQRQQPPRYDRNQQYE